MEDYINYTWKMFIQTTKILTSTVYLLYFYVRLTVIHLIAVFGGKASS